LKKSRKLQHLHSIDNELKLNRWP